MSNGTFENSTFHYQQGPETLCFLNVCFVPSNTPGSTCLSFRVQRTSEHLENAVCAGRSPAHQPVLQHCGFLLVKDTRLRWGGENRSLHTLRISSTAFPGLPQLWQGSAETATTPHKSPYLGGIYQCSAEV